MSEKPTILFLAVIPADYSPLLAASYGMQRTFDLLPHKLSVLALVAWLREHDCEGNYVWASAADENRLTILSHAIKRVRPHALGFSLVTEEFIAHYRVMEELKKEFPDIPFIVGGPHVTGQPEYTLERFPAIDYVVVGEGEQTLEELLKALASGAGKGDIAKISGVASRDEQGRIMVGAPRDCIEDINVLPDPAYDLIFDPDSPPDQRSTFPIVSSYGCYFHCTFCSVPHGHYRNFTAERVVDRIERLQKRFGVEYFAIRDSFWPPKKEWLDKFCDEVEKRKLKIQFHFQTRAGVLEEKHFARLKKLGVQAIAIGVEAGDPAILKSIKKGITVDQARATFKALNSAGIFSIAFFIFGNKGENGRTVHASIDLANELNGSIAFFYVLYPLPGSEAFQSVPDDRKDWWMTGVPPSICDLTLLELERLTAYAFWKYPLRWAYLRQHVLGGDLTPEFRRIARKVFTVHLRKFTLGMMERVGPMRRLIRFLKHER